MSGYTVGSGPYILLGVVAVLLYWNRRPTFGSTRSRNNHDRQTRHGEAGRADRTVGGEPAFARRAATPDPTLRSRHPHRQPDPR